MATAAGMDSALLSALNATEEGLGELQLQNKKVYYHQVLQMKRMYLNISL